MRQPTGYEDGTGCVCRLKKTLYGLKQAGNEWNNKLNGSMVEFSYKRLWSDYGVYYLCSSDKFSIVLVWVNDITVFGNSIATNNELVEKLKKKYKVKVIREPTLLLGIHITRDRPNRMITLSQKRYITKILECTRMKDLKLVHTLMDPNVAPVTNTSEPGQSEMKRTSMEYATCIGELLYTTHATRLDILYATTMLAQFTSSPAEEHWTALKQVFRYLRGTMDHSLLPLVSPSLQLSCPPLVLRPPLLPLHFQSIACVIAVLATYFAAPLVFLSPPHTLLHLLHTS
jgi:hypothetical protein